MHDSYRKYWYSVQSKRKFVKKRKRCQAQAQALSTFGVSSSVNLKIKYPTESPKMIARKTPPLNDMMANIRRYPIAELIPKRTADANLADRRYLGRRGTAAESVAVEVEVGWDGFEFEEARDLKRRRRSSMYW